MLRLDGTLERIQRWDERVCARSNRWLHVPALLVLFRAVSRLGDGLFWYALMLALLSASPRAAAGPVLHMAATGAACTLAYKLLKRGTLRPRPFQSLAHIAAGAAPLDAYSFPSGHTLHAVAFTLVALAYWPWLAPVLVPFTLLTAASRIALGLHYPSDVLAGAALGAAIASATFAFA
ncbi:MAG: phosphatase PAP2 family protein [Burkholderiales bacterium]